jgi:hypothetical protein
MVAREKLQLAVFDAETDPFKHGRVVRPFCCQFYTDGLTEVFWGDDCIEKFAAWLENQPRRYMIFAHNGGKFDFHFLHEYIDNPIQVIKSRIVSASMFHHVLRDSYAILPVPLRDYAKDDFDYAKMERPRRERHKREILEYLHSDCLNLYSLVAKFVEQFGVRLTIGGTAMREIKRRYEFERMTPDGDQTFRRFYFGGRVQCFRSGILEGPWTAYDINSQYPHVMKTRLHPVNGNFEETMRRPRSFKRPYFLRFIGRNKNAIPARGDDGSLVFDKPQGEFHACSHELEIALDHGLVEIDKVLECWVANETISFGDYVDEFFEMKLRAEKAGDKAGRLFAKLLLNSAYGKFGQSPEHFRDYHICRDPEEWDGLQEQGFWLEAEYPQFTLWGKKPDDTDGGLYDVSIAASITSAARAVLLDGLQRAVEPIYCDTDSIICKSLKGEVSATKLGAFKNEGSAKTAAIAGKKMYALYEKERGKPTKLASKGGDLKLRDIVAMCRGATITHKRDAPSFSTARPVNSDPAKLFITRRFTMTAGNVDRRRKPA